MRNLTLLLLCMLMFGNLVAQPSVSFVISSQTNLETDGNIQIAVNILNPNANATSVDINVTGGTAVYGTNFTYSPVTVTFAGGQTFGELFNINIIDDSVPDGDKTIVFSLSNPTNGASIGSPGQLTLTIKDADTPKISITPSTQTIDENAGVVNVPVTLNRGVRDTTKVQLNMVPQGTTAVNGVDYTFNNVTLVWPPDSAGTIYAHIPISNNPFYEHDRTVELALTGPTNNAILTDTTFKLLIRANSLYTDPGCSDLFFGQYVHGSANNQAVQIYNPTSVPIDLSVYSLLISANGGGLRTTYSLSGTIAPGGVYTLANPAADAGILTWANATTSFISFDGTAAIALLHLTDTIDIIGQLNVNPGTGGWNVIGGSTVQHTLIRNYYDHAGDTSWTGAASTWNAYSEDMFDSLGFHHTSSCGSNTPVATVRFLTASDTVMQENQYVYVSVEVVNPTLDTLQFSIAVDPALSTASNSFTGDYLFHTNIVNSPPGSTTYSFYIQVYSNAEMSPTKTVVLHFVNLPSNMIAIPDSVFTLYITNNNKFVVSFLGAGYSYPKNAGRVKVPVITSTFSQTPTTADVSLSNGSAVLGQDFVFTDTTVTFPAFSTDTQGVWVTLINNNQYQTNKQINFNLSNIINSTYSPVLGISGFTLTIINNDSLASGITEAEIDNINIYPNPVSDAITLQSKTALGRVQIMDMVGNQIADFGNLPGRENRIDISLLPSGIYFLNYTVDGRLYCKRFVKAE